MESPLNPQLNEHSLLPPHRAFAEISLSRLAENYRAIQRVLPASAGMMPVVKANAYGHGAIPVSHKLVECGARWLAVSSVDEGVALRESGITPSTRILVMAGILPFEWPAVVEHSLTPVLHQLDQVMYLDQLALSQQTTIPFHFKFDTGLGRMGSSESAESAESVFASLQGAILEGCLTHFASAANQRSDQTEEQIRQFDLILARLASRGIKPSLLHTDSTNSLHFPRAQAARQLVRPGHALYGYVTQPPDSPSQGALDVAPVLTWKTRILLLKDIPKGAAIGYGALHKTSRPTRIAVLGIGYADGYPHRLSNKGKVLVRGAFAPVLGAISMDLTTIDVTGIEGLSTGDVVTLIGESGRNKIDAIDLGRMAGTISYSVLTNIHGRVKRIYTA